MIDLYDAATRAALLARLDRLESDSPRQWGTMTPAQMCAHCAEALGTPNDDAPRPQMLIGKLLSWSVRKKYLGEARLPKNSPTHPDFVVRDERDLAVERARLLAEIDRFVARGPELAGRQKHAFFGRLSGPEWGVVMGKHLDHHLRQFGL
jgi:hypothetical protein